MRILSYKEMRVRSSGCIVKVQLWSNGKVWDGINWYDLAAFEEIR